MCVHVTGNKMRNLLRSTMSEILKVWMGMMPQSSPSLTLYKSKYKYDYEYECTNIRVWLYDVFLSWFFVWDCSEEDVEEFRALKEKLNGEFIHLYCCCSVGTVLVLAHRVLKKYSFSTVTTCYLLWSLESSFVLCRLCVRWRIIWRTKISTSKPEAMTLKQWIKVKIWTWWSFVLGHRGQFMVRPRPR